MLLIQHVFEQLKLFFSLLSLCVYVQSTQTLFKFLKELLTFFIIFLTFLKAIKEQESLKLTITMLPKWPMLLSLLAIFIFFSSFTHGGSQSHFQSPPLPGIYHFFFTFHVQIFLLYASSFPADVLRILSFILVVIILIL